MPENASEGMQAGWGWERMKCRKSVEDQECCRAVEEIWG